MNMPNLGLFKERSESSCDKIFYLSLVGFTLLHIVILLTTPLDLVSDEALYWEYSKHLDWSYYAKGPGIGVANWISSSIFGDTAFGVRSIALFCFGIFSAMLYLFVKRAYSAPTALAVFLFVRVTIFFIYTGFISTTDPLVILFWLSSLIFAYFAISKNNTKYWAAALPLVGLAILAKYTAAILIPGYGAVLLFHRSLQHHLKSLGWWLGCLLFLIFISPIFIWNAQHEWANFQHNLGHAVGKSTPIYFQKLPELIAGQIGLLGPVFFALLCLAIWSGVRRWFKESDPILALWLSATVPLLLVCINVSATRSCYGNWPLPAYIGGLLLVVHEFKNLNKESWFRKAIIVNVVMALPVQLVWYLPLILPDNVPLPLLVRRMVGWTSLGGEVEKFVRNHNPSGNMPFVLATDYMTAASLTFAIKPDIQVRLGSFQGRRLSEQDYWQSWSELIDKDALVVSKEDSKDVINGVPGWFKKCQKVEINNLPPPERLAKDFSFLLCKNFTGKEPVITGAW